MIELVAGTAGTYGIPIGIKGTTGYAPTIYVSTDGTNCKLSYIHGAGNLQGLKEEELKTVFDGTLIHAKGCVILNTTSITIFNFIRKTYPIYYQHSVPIGYGTGFQYHICFKNVIKVNGACRDPQPLPTDKMGIKQKLLTLLKDRRRKTDYVDEFINSL